VRNLDFSSWQGVLLTLAGLALVTLIGVGIRLLMMFTVQARRERMNRQINERLRTLIAAYKVLGGSFTGDLTVDPRHLRDVRQDQEGMDGSDRARRIRDAVEGALADVILLGTEQHVRLAQFVVQELVAGRPVKTDELVASLRAFIRQALDLDPIPRDLLISVQGPARILATAKGKGDSGRNKGGGKGAGMMGGGMALGGGAGLGAGLREDDQTNEHS
jgi:hypothetical protein